MVVKQRSMDEGHSTSFKQERTFPETHSKHLNPPPQQKRTSHPGHLGARRLWSIHRQRCIPICFVALCSSSPDFLQPFCRSSANVDDALSKKCILLDLEINILYQTIIIILMLYYKVTAVFLNASPSVFFYHTERWKKFNFQEESGRRQASLW